MREADQGQGLFGALLDFALRPARDPEAVADILEDGHVREEGVGLEHHGDVAVGGRQVGDVALADVDAAGCRQLQSGDHPERRRLAATGGAEEGDEVALLDGEADLLDRHGLAEGLGDLVEADGDLAHLPAPAKPVGAGPAADRRPRRRSPMRSWKMPMTMSMTTMSTEL